MSPRPQHAGSPGSILHAGDTGRSGIVSFSEGERDHFARSAGDMILIDERNRAIGVAGKQWVHRVGLLHRAFSVFLMDARGNILLQRRSPAKYHSAGLWANSCCGHPMPGERTLAAARRRTFEELGVRANLSFCFHDQVRRRHRHALGRAGRADTAALARKGDQKLRRAVRTTRSGEAVRQNQPG